VELCNNDLFNKLWTNSTHQMENLAQHEYILQPRIFVEVDHAEAHDQQQYEEAEE